MFRFSGVFFWIGLIVLIILTYFVVDYGKGVTYDFWGRERFEALFLLKWIGINDNPGLLWWIGDILIANTLITIGNYLISRSKSSANRLLLIKAFFGDLGFLTYFQKSVGRQIFPSFNTFIIFN